MEVCYLCFVEARPTVQGVFTLRFLVGASFADALGDPRAWTAVPVWACTVWAVYLLNGVADVVEDRVNGSPRPVASGALGPEEARAGVAILAGLALLGAAVLGRPPLWGVLAALALGWAYSGPPLYLKRWPAGLAAMAALGGLLTYYAGYAAGGGEARNLPELLAFAGVMSLWMGLVGQAKDLSDVEGDEQAGRRSLPVVWGQRTTRLIVSAAAFLLGGGLLACSVLFLPGLLLPAVAVALGASVLVATALGPWGRGGGRARRRRPYRIFMITQYAANAAMIN
jgi:4-hydroxybenzoate polyprenyltransferase